jgi:hypothetical protein
LDLAASLIGKLSHIAPGGLESKTREEAEEELLTRLVALNEKRTADEARRRVRWLRPDYRIEKLGHKVPQPDEKEEAALEDAIPAMDKSAWP